MVSRFKFVLNGADNFHSSLFHGSVDVLRHLPGGTTNVKVAILLQHALVHGLASLTKDELAETPVPKEWSGKSFSKSREVDFVLAFSGT